MTTVAQNTVVKYAHGVHMWSWDNLTETNVDGAPITPQLGCPFFGDKTVQVIFNGSPTTPQVDIEGSNDGTTWFVLSDPLGSPLSFSANGFAAILENPLYIRPNVSAGTSVDADVKISGRGGLELR